MTPMDITLMAVIFTPIVIMLWTMCLALAARFWRDFRGE